MLLMCRSWGIGSRPTGAHRKGFDNSLQVLAASLQQHGGPFLLGQQLTLVSSCASLQKLQAC